MDGMNPIVDDFLRQTDKWQNEFKKLREIILEFRLTEELKWGVPCYTLEGKNVLLIHGFKEYCAILFLKGALFQDPHGILIQQTENVQAGRQMRFTNVREIQEKESWVKDFIRQAISVEQAGLQVKKTDRAELVFPEEVQRIFRENPAVKTAFEALTPGRQRAYQLYFSAPKQAKTREERIQKSIPKILIGKGLDDL